LTTSRRPNKIWCLWTAGNGFSAGIAYRPACRTTLVFASSGIYTILQTVNFEKRVMTAENMFLAKFHHFTTIFKVEFLLIIFPVLCLAAMMPTLLPFFNIVVEIPVGRV
jgi:hypothetical protein